jgi:hypothetical protein
MGTVPTRVGYGLLAGADLHLVTRPPGLSASPTEFEDL